MRVRSDSSAAQPRQDDDIIPISSSDTRVGTGMEPLCLEKYGETTRKYSIRIPREKSSSKPKKRADALLFSDTAKEKNPIEFMSYVFRSYFLPAGFPDSVNPSYTPYMQWRFVQFFFGGAMSVFTTRSLLHSLGIARGAGHATSAALAVNWVIKDGAGRLGKMLFAAQGKRFDSDLKQMRFTSSMLMNVGCGIELSTVTAPHLFLPLACLANVLKNIGAVTNTSTRAPIYKAFARKENLGDITAKGESISNMADLMGTGFGILLAKQNPSLRAAFWSLSFGYVIASYNEIRSVHLPTLNRSRFSVAVKKFLEAGEVPGVPDVSRLERIVAPPWATERPLEIGARVGEAFESAEQFRTASRLCQGERFLVTFRPSQRKAYVVLREGATGRDVLRGAFRAHVMLHNLSCQVMADRKQGVEHVLTDSSGCGATKVADSGLTQQYSWPAQQQARESSVEPCWGLEDEWAMSEAPLATLRQRWPTGWIRRNARERARQHELTAADVTCALAHSRAPSENLFEDFVARAKAKGWVLADSLLNPGEARLLNHTPGHAA